MRLEARQAAQPLRRPCAGAMMLLVAACGGPVTVTMRNGARHEGRAITNDDTRLVIETDEKRMVLCKRAIHDVDHPGNGAAILGLILVAGGAAIVTADALIEEEEGDIGAAPDPTFFGLSLATAGAVVAVVGGRRWLDARAATGWPPDRDLSAEPCQD